jgi:hypothetical protein
LDFAKAFDKVSHKALIRKLEGLGFTGTLLKWLTNFMTGRRQRVVIDGHHSEWKEVVSGVAQGSVLGPLLFVIFINDMPEVCKNICKLFADDSKLISQIRNREDQEIVQEDLNALVKWSRDWNMLFNSSKCKIMRIGQILNPLDFYMEDEQGEKCVLSETKLERDLGVMISNDLKWSSNSNRAAAKANSMLGQLKRTMIHWDNFTLKRLYTTFVRPHLEYANSACCPYRQKDIKAIEVVQRRATKLVPDLKNMRNGWLSLN